MDSYSIVVSVSELRSRIKDVRRSGADFVELTFCPPEKEDDELFPAHLDFSAPSGSDTSMWIDYEGIDALENEEELKKLSFSAAHMSDNLS